MTKTIQRLRLRQILTVFLAGLVLCITTACNTGNAQGARPNVPPVQMGGQNNPHKAGGDGYTQYKAPSAKAKSSNQASLQLTNNWLIAARNPSNPNQNAERMLYKTDTKVDEQEIPVIEQGKQEVKQIPAESQAVIDRSNPNEAILEKTGEAFKKSTKFFTEGVDKAFSGSER